MSAGIHTSIEKLIRELKIADPTETCVGTWDGPEGEMRVALIHETGHVYAVSEDEAANDPGPPVPAAGGEDRRGSRHRGRGKAP